MDAYNIAADGSHTGARDATAALRKTLAEIGYSLVLTGWNFTLLVGEVSILITYRILRALLGSIYGLWQYTVVSPMQFTWHIFLRIYERLIIPMFYFTLLASLMGMVAGIFVGVYAVFVQSLIPHNNRQTVRHNVSHSPVIKGKTVVVRRKSSGTSETTQTRFVISAGSAADLTLSPYNSPSRRRISLPSSVDISPTQSSTHLSEAAIDTSTRHAGLYEDDDGYLAQLMTTASRQSSRASLRNLAVKTSTLVIRERDDESGRYTPSPFRRLEDDDSADDGGRDSRGSLDEEYNLPVWVANSGKQENDFKLYSRPALERKPSTSSESSVRFIESCFGDEDTAKSTSYTDAGLKGSAPSSPGKDQSNSSVRRRPVATG